MSTRQVLQEMLTSYTVILRWIARLLGKPVTACLFHEVARRNSPAKADLHPEGHTPKPTSANSSAGSMGSGFRNLKLRKRPSNIKNPAHGCPAALSLRLGGRSFESSSLPPLFQGGRDLTEQQEKHYVTTYRSSTYRERERDRELERESVDRR